jgi:two-component system response regulator NreC
MDNNIKAVARYIDIRTFTSFDALINNLSEKEKLDKTHIILDIEHDLHVDFTHKIKSLHSNVNILAVGFPKEISKLKELFQIGYNAYLDTTNNELDLVKALEKVSKKKFYLPERLADELIQNMIQENKEKNNSSFLDDEKIEVLQLSKKDKEVVEYLIKGYTYKNIAEILGLTTFAVNQRTKSVYKKCGVRSRSELSYLLLK